METINLHIQESQQLQVENLKEIHNQPYHKLSTAKTKDRILKAASDKQFIKKDLQ